jgi:two-component system, NarL family, response regulator DesR
VVADDHPLLRQAVSAILAEHGIDVVALASDGEEALAAIAAQRPRVAILDVMMPRLSGIDVARRIARVAPETGVIFYTGSAEHSLLVDALAAGALGFVSKAAPTQDLVRAVESVAAGEGYVDPRLAPTVVRASVEAGLPLSPRERDILRLLSEGKSNGVVGETLHIAPDTVRTYLRRAMKKLEAETRTQAVAKAIRLSLID